MELRTLVAQNPWWSETESIKSDFYIQQFSDRSSIGVKMNWTK